MVFRFWNGTVAGTLVGHGEVIKGWSANGGELHVQSAPRLAFLKQILEAGPREGLDVIDQDFEPEVAGQAGEYYLIYLGKDAPTNWVFQFYKRGVTADMKFKVDVIDAWNMTITPVAGEFVTKKKDNYDFVDAQGRSVPLPGKPYIALRIVNVSGLTNRSDPNEFIDLIIDPPTVRC